MSTPTPGVGVDKCGLQNIRSTQPCSPPRLGNAPMPPKHDSNKRLSDQEVEEASDGGGSMQTAPKAPSEHTRNAKGVRRDRIEEGIRGMHPLHGLHAWHMHACTCRGACMHACMTCSTCTTLMPCKEWCVQAYTCFATIHSNYHCHALPPCPCVGKSKKDGKGGKGGKGGKRGKGGEGRGDLKPCTLPLLPLPLPSPPLPHKIPFTCM